jgi:peptide-methionine (S)-S-oxide reductase
MALLSKKTTIPAESDALPGRNTPLPLSGKHFVNGSNIKQPATGGLEEAVFGLGCFWGAERKFWQIPGVVTTAVGYAGGYTPNATYEEVCSGRTGHTEVVRVIYDPNKVSYDALLKAFWESHDPTQGMRQGGDVGTQYRSAIYTTTDGFLMTGDPQASRNAAQSRSPAWPSPRAFPAPARPASGSAARRRRAAGPGQCRAAHAAPISRPRCRS